MPLLRAGAGGQAVRRTSVRRRWGGLVNRLSPCLLKPRPIPRWSAAPAGSTANSPGCTRTSAPTTSPTPLELLGRHILSAQSTDKRVNEVTPALFTRWTRRPPSTPRPIGPSWRSPIQATGFFRAKANSLIGLGQALCDRNGGEVPGRLVDLVTLPRRRSQDRQRRARRRLRGPGHHGRHPLRPPRPPARVDREEDPVKVEHEVGALFPRKEWTLLSPPADLPRPPRCHARPPGLRRLRRWPARARPSASARPTRRGRSSWSRPGRSVTGPAWGRTGWHERTVVEPSPRWLTVLAQRAAVMPGPAGLAAARDGGRDRRGPHPAWRRPLRSRPAAGRARPRTAARTPVNRRSPAGPSIPATSTRCRPLCARPPRRPGWTRAVDVVDRRCPGCASAPPASSSPRCSGGGGGRARSARCRPARGHRWPSGSRWRSWPTREPARGPTPAPVPAGMTFTTPAFRACAAWSSGVSPPGLLDRLLALGGWERPWDASHPEDLPPDALAAPGSGNGGVS